MKKIILRIIFILSIPFAVLGMFVVLFISPICWIFTSKLFIDNYFNFLDDYFNKIMRL